MLHPPQPACKPQKASQQAGGSGCAAAAGQATWAAAPAMPATELPALPVQLLPGFDLWLCIGRPPLQLFLQPGGPWLAGFALAPGQALPVMAASSQEALAAEAATAQGLVLAEAMQPPADRSIAAAPMAAQQQQPLGAIAAGSSHDAAKVMREEEQSAGGQPQVLCRTSSTHSLSCSEQLSQGVADEAAAGQQAESTGEQPAMAMLPLSQGQPQEWVPQQGEQHQAWPPIGRPSKRKVAAMAAEDAAPVAGGEAEGQEGLATALPAGSPAAAVGSMDGGPCSKCVPAARRASQQAAAARAVGLATAAGQQQGRLPSWLLQPATNGPSGVPAAAAAAAQGAVAEADAATAQLLQPIRLAAVPLHHPALSHESNSCQQMDRPRSASPAAAAAGGGAAVDAAHAWPPALPALLTPRSGPQDKAAAEPVPAGGSSAGQCSEDEVAAAEMLQALAAAAGSGSTTMEPLSPLSPQRGAPELSSLSSSRSALHAHLQPCGTAIEATAPTWVTFDLPTEAVGGAAGAVAPVRCRFLFQKPLSASDAGRLGRMVMPRCAEHYLPQPEGPEGMWLDVMDRQGHRYQWLLKFWLSHTQTASGGPAKRTYVVENCRPWQLAWQVSARTTLAFYLLPSGGYLVDPYPVESHFSNA